ncbi:hypothetical protein QE418_003382 [Microbacterium testaceum]|uniref:DUF5403 family protein n=1 Tax=Microbacterium TaxID=33882 RepID=UPI00277EC368|nr:MULTISPECIES: DUF5403 family protein [Microbacterium]MDQ1113934.1 hypothetical protein [Microbacterium testaceum]MDR6098959.1 hypothetical protein [Microbacterium sp. SORGH_AS_0454]
MAGDSNAFDAIASKVLRLAQTEALKSVDTGAYLSHLHMKTVPGERGTGRGVNDRLIVADDPGAGPIEWGHIYRHPGSRRVTYVPGKHIMTNALARARWGV